MDRLKDKRDAMCTACGAEASCSHSSPEDNENGRIAIVNRLSRTLAAANRYLSQLLREQELCGIVPSHGDILTLLLRGSSVSMKTLAQYIGRDPSTVTTLVRKLIDAGYVEKVPNPDDRRGTDVILTDSGRDLKGRFDAISDQLIGTIRSVLSDEEIDQTERLLERIRIAFEEKMKQ